MHKTDLPPREKVFQLAEVVKGWWPDLWSTWGLAIEDLGRLDDASDFELAADITRRLCETKAVLLENLVREGFADCNAEAFRLGKSIEALRLLESHKPVTPGYEYLATH